ncbi:MAG: CDP-alcohol phosphatidyltransferase family protein [Actinobacteria bacterium]|nr:CDP-alcohol phosphatidyltransferase family protein [Actinomycetota bacterium]
MTVHASVEAAERRTFRERYRDDVAALGTVQKSSRGAPLYSLRVNRPLGRRLAALAHQLGLRPNQVSVISALFTMTGLVVLAAAEPTWSRSCVVASLLVLGYGIDAADGQLARLTTGGSLAGEWLDHTLDMVKAGSFHAAVLVSAARFSDGLGVWPQAVALGFMVVATSSFFVLILTEQLRRSAGAGAPARPATWWFVLLGLPTDYGLQCLWMVARPADRVFFAGYAVLAAANLGYLGVSAVGRFRQLSALDAAGRVPR